MSTGFSLLEVLIALCLLGIALLSLEKMEWLGVRCNHYAFFETQASLQVESMSTVLRLQRALGGYFTVWQQDNSHLLPSGEGIVQQQGAVWHIMVRWRSAVSHGWHCDASPISGYACVEGYSG